MTSKLVSWPLESKKSVLQCACFGRKSSDLLVTIIVNTYVHCT